MINSFILNRKVIMLMLLDDYQLILRNDIQMILHVLPILDV